ncbi:hypothetical protein [Dysgonomonas macrotermitis]|uniref:C1q domain-containing protein n=1 Tax=Dysgonomonas macrotermitis TaxID=1346286 RepID=A0A1M4T9U6_9BACT|nr:hypothetical protein [Dysgonomonas macrotermitis]SHE41017.1 hypothetical protein SAMN05444362_101269 [Dysgonomonas macrotermitis]
MKYNIVSLMLIFCFAGNAQVGINTNNAQGIFHIDTRGNNATTGVPATSQLTDDVIVAANASTGVNMSIGGKTAANSSAQLALLATDKAILLNRVALTDLRDITTIPNPETGTIVYNTATSGTYPDNIIPGYYYFNGVVWYKWQYGQVNSDLSQHDLLTSCTSVGLPSLGNASSPMTATLANFGTIQIKEKGTYIFSLRLYGPATANSSGATAPTFTRTINYLYMMKNGSTKVASMEINVPLPAGGTVAFTHTVSMQAVLDKDDIVTFRLGHYTGYYGWQLYANPYLRANKTSLIYWKI